MSTREEKNELVIVFKKAVSEEEALKKMNSFEVNFRKGMDSSKGKIYFYNTGSKYIISFENQEQKEKFQYQHYEFLSEIHQIYEPDWDICKD